MSNNELTVAHALRHLKEQGAEFAELFAHGSLVVEFFKPNGRDLQTPHLRDELYFIAQGSGTIRIDDALRAVATGDVVFVPAGVPHRFENFSDDFATWAIFYGPQGGEAAH